MGINDEYSRDAYLGDHYAYDSDESDDFDTDVHPEDWQDLYSQELLDGWMNIRQYLDEKYLPYRANFPEFVQLVMLPGNWYSTHEPTTLQLEMWNRIKNFPIIRERVLAENFYAWSENYIG